MFRALCHQIWEIVEDRFPEARHSAIGSFIFLRFFCPAIVSPEGIDLDIPSESREIRRALLLITKVIQNLANNVKFKEPHMQILNSFLAENIKQVTRFLSDIAVSLYPPFLGRNADGQMRPRSWELTQAVKQYSDETEKSQDRDVDNEIL
jgi:neurofibromin 1